MKLSYSPRAVSDLADISDYLVARSPAGALFVESSIRKTIDIIVAFAQAGRALEQRPHVRVMPLGRYPYLLSTLYGAMKLSSCISATADASRSIPANFDPRTLKCRA